MITPVILSGSNGSGLWPLSRESSPLSICDERSPFQETLLRLEDLSAAGEAVIVCSEDHRFDVERQFKDIKTDVGTVYLEQTGRGALPAITVAALAMNPEELILVLPADHHITNPEVLYGNVEKAARCAGDGLLVCFGSKPTKPETEYRYIVPGRELNEAYPGLDARSITKFAENPGYEHAQFYISQGAYWNSGIFLFRVDAILDAVRRYQPSIYFFCRKALQYAQREETFVTLKGHLMSQCPAISIDYGVMEHEYDSVVLPLDTPGNGVESWSGAWEFCEWGRSGKGNPSRSLSG